ncbi:hypothetical protein TNCV_2659341 [Trichonephila clavipes]|nr:hypothetical protein TNCV_2659341 [Trichonephila clavipes]
MVTDTSWTIMPEVIKIGSLRISLTFNSYPHSLDLKPIENVWDIVERRIQQYSPLPSNLQDKKSCIVNAWYSLDVTALQKRVDSMPKRIRAVIHAKGGPIKYLSWPSSCKSSREVGGRGRDVGGPCPPSGCSPSKLGGTELNRLCECQLCGAQRYGYRQACVTN